MTKNFSYIGEINNFKGKKVNSIEELYANNIPLFDQESETAALAPVIWLKAETINQSHRTRVPTWNDYSGNNNNFISYSQNNQPFYIKNVINGYDVVRFNEKNTDNHFLYLLNPNQDIKSTEITLYAVMKNNSTVNGYNAAITYQVSTASAVSPYCNWNIFFKNNNTLHSRLSNQVLESNVENIKYSNFSIYRLNNKPNHTLFINGISEMSMGGKNIDYSTNTQQEGIMIGQTYLTNASEQCGLDIAEIIFFNYTLNDDQIEIVDNYLHTKYGIYKKPLYIDNFNNYSVNQNNNFNKGSGFSNGWVIKPAFYSIKGYDQFNYTDINLPLNADPINGFADSWVIKPAFYSLRGLDTFEAYSSPINMNGGINFDGKWVFKDYKWGLTGIEAFETYENTIGMNEGTGFLDEWKINKNPYGLKGTEDFEEYSSTENMNSGTGFLSEWKINKNPYGLKGHDDFESYSNTENMNSGVGFNGEFKFEDNTFGVRGYDDFESYLSVESMSYEYSYGYGFDSAFYFEDNTLTAKYDFFEIYSDIQNMDASDKGFNGSWIIKDSNMGIRGNDDFESYTDVQNMNASDKGFNGNWVVK